MKKIFQILLIVCGGLAMNSCYYDAYPEYEEVDNGGGGTGGVEISYATNIAPLWSSCVGCHNANRAPDLRAGNSYNALVPQYVTAGNANGSPLYIKLADGHQNLATEKIALIKTWINQGAKNN